MRTARWLVGPLLLGGFPAAAQEAAFQLPPGASFVETYTGRDEGVNASGRVLVGAYLGTTDQAFSRPSLNLVIAPDTTDICLRVTTIDGRYWSLNRFVGGGSVGTVARIDLPTEHAPQLGAYRRTDIAVRATADAECGEVVDGPVMPVLLGDQAAGGELMLLVNAGPSQAGARIAGEGAFETCTEVSDRTSVAFTHECRLEIGDADGGLIEVEIAVIGVLGGRESTSYRVQVGPD